MRELERSPKITFALHSVAVVGAGRLGSNLTPALTRAGLRVTGPLGRHESRSPRRLDVDAVLLCVPDSEITAAAAAVVPGPLVGHCSGATSLNAIKGHDAFSLHPLMTFAGAGPQPELAGVGAAIAGGTDRAQAAARFLAEAMGMVPFPIPEERRAAYHAAASMASNYLITLEAGAERLAADAGCPPALLTPLVRATVENWATLGAERALTGPVARGDTVTVDRQRAAIAQGAPDLLALFDELTQATRVLAGVAVPA